MDIHPFVPTTSASPHHFTIRSNKDQLSPARQSDTVKAKDVKVAIVHHKALSFETHGSDIVNPVIVAIFFFFKAIITRKCARTVVVMVETATRIAI